MAKTFDLTKISSGKTALEVKNKVLAEKPINKNSKILENDSQILETKTEVVSPVQEKVTLATVQEQPATRTETAQGEAQTPTLPDAPENSELTILEPQAKNAKQHGSDTGSNMVQTRFKHGSDTGSNGKEHGSDTGSNMVQTRFKHGSDTGSNGKEHGSDTGSPKSYQHGSNMVQIHPKKLGDLMGWNKWLLYFFYMNCKANNALETKPFKKADLIASLECKYETFRTSEKRLRKAGFVSTKVRHGRYGGTTYVLTKEVFNEVKNDEFWFGLGFKHGSDTGSDTGSNTTTTTDYLKFKEVVRIPETLKTKISSRELFDYHKGHDFWTVEAINETLRHFEYDNYNGLIKTTDQFPSTYSFLFTAFKNGRAYISGALEKMEMASKKAQHNDAISFVFSVVQPEDEAYKKYLIHVSLAFVDDYKNLQNSGLAVEKINEQMKKTYRKRYEDSLT